MVIYFTGTGNSRYVAESIANLVGDSIACSNEDIKGCKGRDFTSLKPYVFVCPTYAWRIPRVFASFIEKNTFTESQKTYFVMTCGDGIGDAEAYIARLCAKKELQYMGVSAVVMPENYIAMFKVPDKVSSKRIIAAAEGKIREVSAQILEVKPLRKEKAGPLSYLQSHIINPAFYSMYVSARGFYATDRCVACGICAKLCPTNNITVTQKPAWGDECTHCMACICGCPTEAIEYKKKSQGKHRFLNREKAIIK